MLATRRGIPITLALLYIELAAQLGLSARGVSFPGHFLVKLRMPQGEVVHRPVQRPVAVARRTRRAAGAVPPPPAGWWANSKRRSGLFLQAAPPRDVLARMLRNLKEIHRSGRGLAASAGRAASDW